MASNGYDPSRILSNGERVFESLRRLTAIDDLLRLQAMAYAKGLIREGATREEAEELTYAVVFGKERFSEALELKRGRKTLEEALQEGRV